MVTKIGGKLAKSGLATPQVAAAAQIKATEEVRDEVRALRGSIDKMIKLLENQKK